MAGFNANLRRIMKREGIGPTALGRLMGVHRNNVYAWMDYVREPKQETIVKLAEALGVGELELVPDWEERYGNLQDGSEGQGD